MAKKIAAKHENLIRRGKVLEERKKRTRDQYQIFVGGNLTMDGLKPSKVAKK
jgi:hypothetical protein